MAAAIVGLSDGKEPALASHDFVKVGFESSA